MFMDQDTVEVYKLGQIQKIQKEGAKSPALPPPPPPTSYSIVGVFVMQSKVATFWKIELKSIL